MELSNVKERRGRHTNRKHSNTTNNNDSIKCTNNGNTDS